MSKSVKRHHLILLSALAGAAYSGAPRNVLAGQCSPASGPDIVCSNPPNANTDVTQTLSDAGNGTSVTTQPGFGIDTSESGGNAISITSGSTGLTFNDQNHATITGAQVGLATILNGGNRLTITSNGSITGIVDDGILAQNNGTGVLEINAAAVSGGAGGDGIQATNGATGNSAGTDIRITTSGPITGGQMAIIARNYGSGEIVINAKDSVIVTGGNFGDQWAGIFGRNGNMAFDGTVTYAGTNIKITASGQVTGFYNGVASYNFGSGSNTVHVTGDVLGKAQAGILARNGFFDPPGGGGPVQAGTSITVTAEGNVTGAVQGIRVDNVGTGHIEITALGNTTGVVENGIVAHNSEYGTYLSISAKNVIGGTNGINALNEGRGLLTVTTSGLVTGGTNGMLLATKSSSAELYVSGLVAGTRTAVDATGVAQTFRLELQPGYGFRGIVDARNGGGDPQGNRLVFGGPAGEARFDLSRISGTVPRSRDVYFGFDDVFLKEDASNFIFGGGNRAGAEFTEAAVTGTGLAVLDRGTHLVMADGAGPFTVQSGGLGAIGRGSLLDGSVSVWQAGAIVLSNASPFDPVSRLAGANDVLTISGRYQSDGGALYVDTVLDNGSTNISDKLVVKGDTSGTTTVFVANAGGSGGITGRRPTDGIKVVQVDGWSDGSFKLGAPVYAGAFQYGLFQADGQNWYLQTSNLRDQAVIGPYIPYSLRTFGRQITGSYLERNDTRVGWRSDPIGSSGAGSGADMPLPVKGAAAAPPSPGSGMWARALGAWSNADGALLGGFNNVSYDEKLWAVQGGLDAVIAQSNAGTLLASGFLHYGGINTRSANTLTGSPAGTVDTNGWGGGVSLTYAAQGGFYLDGVATYTRYDLDVTAAAGGTASTKSDGWTISGEVGHRFAVTNWFALIPQAQVTYQRIALSGFTDNVGVTTGFSDADSLEGRLGARLEFAGMPAARFYVGGHFLHEFLSNPVVNVAGTPLALDFDGSGYQFEAGVRVGQIGGRVSAWLRGDYRAPFDAANGIATWNAMGGVAVRF